MTPDADTSGMALERLEPPTPDDANERAAAFDASKRACLRGCAAVVLGVLLLAVTAYLVLGVYLHVIYERHPN